ALTSHQSTTFSPFFFTATAPSSIYTLSLHDALPIFPVVEVRRQGVEPFAREHVGDAFDLIVEAPVLLNDDDARPFPGGGHREVAVRRPAVGFERHVLAHRLRPPLDAVPKDADALDLHLDRVPRL